MRGQDGDRYRGWVGHRLGACADICPLRHVCGPVRQGGLPADPAERFRKLFAVPERAPKETRAVEVLAQNQRVRDGYAGGITLDTALEEALGRIKARTLILFGTADEVVPVETARRLKAGIAHSHLSFVYGAAHALEFDQPQRAARLIAAFLEHGEGFLVRRPGAA